MNLNPAMWLKALQVIPHVTQEEWARLDVISKWLISSQAAVLIMTTISGAIAGILAYQQGSFNFWLWLLLLLGLGVFFVLFYTYPLKYIALGEISVLVVWGPLMIGGGYYVITGGWDWNVVIASLPYALGVTGVIFGKHIDKFEMDKAKRIHTLQSGWSYRYSAGADPQFASYSEFGGKMTSSLPASIS